MQATDGVVRPIQHQKPEPLSGWATASSPLLQAQPPLAEVLPQQLQAVGGGDRQHSDPGGLITRLLTRGFRNLPTLTAKEVKVQHTLQAAEVIS